MNSKFRLHILTAALGMLLLCVPAHAGTALYRVTVNTSSLAGIPGSAPYALDFQFNNGSVLGNNFATVSNFNFFGGGAVGSPTVFDGAFGSIGSQVFFNNSGPFQELMQTFTPGSSLRFDVFFSTNVDGATPDAFSFAILDKNLANIPTSGLGDSLLLINFNNPGPAVQTSSGTGAFSGVTTSAAAVPEPQSAMMILAALPLLAFAVFRRRA